MAGADWTKISGIAAVIAVLLAAIAVCFTYQQLPERRAILRLEVPRVQFANRAPGEWIAAPTVVMKNDGTSRAERVAMEFQH